jgi:hypothetical protein
MHKIGIPSYVIDRALARRGRLNPFDGLDPARTALIVVYLQDGFMAPGQPAETAQAREIVPNVNRLAGATRAAEGKRHRLRRLEIRHRGIPRSQIPLHGRHRPVARSAIDKSVGKEETLTRIDRRRTVLRNH